MRPKTVRLNIESITRTTLCRLDHTTVPRQPFLVCGQRSLAPEQWTLIDASTANSGWLSGTIWWSVHAATLVTSAAKPMQQGAQCRLSMGEENKGDTWSSMNLALYYPPIGCLRQRTFHAGRWRPLRPYAVFYTAYDKLVQFRCIRLEMG